MKFKQLVLLPAAFLVLGSTLTNCTNHQYAVHRPLGGLGGPCNPGNCLNNMGNCVTAQCVLPKGSTNPNDKVCEYSVALSALCRCVPNTLKKCPNTNPQQYTMCIKNPSDDNETYWTSCSATP